MKKYEVTVDKWVDGSGWEYSTTLDWMDELCTVKEYIDSVRDWTDMPAEGEDYLYSIVEHDYDNDDATTVIEEKWLSVYFEEA